jgi:hypothetical protein
VDDPTDDDELCRRLAPHHVRADGTVNSSAFKREKGYDPQISVDLARLTASPGDALRTRPNFGLGILRVGDLRGMGLSVRRDPLPDNPANCLIEGLVTRDQARQLAALTLILVPPTPVA